MEPIIDLPIVEQKDMPKIKKENKEVIQLN